jgi:hypothetical protein
MKPLTCWTATDLETQPRLSRGPDDTVEATFVVGVWTSFDLVPELKCHAEIRARDVTSAPWAPNWAKVDRGQITITPITLDRLRAQDPFPSDLRRLKSWLEARRHVADVRARLDAQPNVATFFGLTHYFEVQIRNLPGGRLLRFRADAILGDLAEVTAASQTVGQWLAWHEFGAEDLVASHVRAEDKHEDQDWLLLHHRDEGFDYLRLDLLMTHNLGPRRGLASGIAPVSITLEGGQCFDFGKPWPLPDAGPWEAFVAGRVDRSTDSMLLTVPRNGAPLRTITVTTRNDGAEFEQVVVPLGPPAGPAEPTGAEDPPEADLPTPPAAVGLMIIGYLNQALNDLFAHPLAAYQPPRNFAQVTFQDEKALFSSRPEARENNIPDGYRYVLEAQKAYGLRMVWSWNGGAALLLKHGLEPAQFDEIVAATRPDPGQPHGDRPLISIANSGYGARRNRYYGLVSNCKELRYADALLDRLFPADAAVDSTEAARSRSTHTNGIYFPDSRVWTDREAERTAVQEVGRDMVRYLVIDRSTATYRPDDGAEALCFVGPDAAPGRQGNYLWRHPDLGLEFLVGEDDLRQHIVNASPDEITRGQVAYAVRLMLMRAVDRTRRGDPQRLFCVADDFDHFSANGWFDGDYAGSENRFATAFLAAACWLEQHPWVQVVTPEDDLAAFRNPEPLGITTAIDPSIDPFGATDVATTPLCPPAWRLYTNNCVCTDRCLGVEGFATPEKLGEVEPGPSEVVTTRIGLDLWERAWSATPALALGPGRTLGQISRKLEQTLETWPERYRNGLADIAWRQFLLSTHECMWSKRRVEAEEDHPANDSPFRWEPEDFVISETLQMRNAWTYLNASVWAAWADEHAGEPNTQILAADSRADPSDSLRGMIRNAGSADPPWHSGRRSSLYWNQTIRPNVVLYNTQMCVVVSRNGGRIVAAFLRTPHGPVSVSGTCKTHQFVTLGDQEIPCDGQRLQGDVYSPNHAYLGADVIQSQPRLGQFFDQRNDRLQQTWLPDSFNAYACRPVTDPEGRPSLRCSYRAGSSTPVPDPEVQCWGQVEKLFAEDLRLVARGGRGIVWHDFPPFHKTIRLEGSTVKIDYGGTGPGHLVSNEITLDLLDMLQGGEGQEYLPPRYTHQASVRRGDLEAVVRLRSGCVFAPATRNTGGKRVLTHDLQVCATGEGGFSYEVEFAHHGSHPG